jgi:PAS domain S-box-containing protein
MTQVGNTIMAFNTDKSDDLFDVQCILNSFPNGVALFDKDLHLVNSNPEFLKMFNPENVALSTVTKIDDILTLSLKNKDLEDENKHTLGLIHEMFKEGSADSSFNWVYKFYPSEDKIIELKTEFFPLRGIIINLKELKKGDDHQLIEFQAAKEYLESQTQQAIHMAEDLAVAKEEAADSEQRIQTILNAMEEGLVTLNQHGKIVSSNNAMSVIFGYAPSEFIGMALYDLVKSSKLQSPEHIRALLNSQVSGHNVYKSDETGRRKDGEAIPLKIDIREVFLEQDKHYTVLFRNVSEQYEAEKLIRHMAWHDSLTGLANRNLLSERLDEALKLATPKVSATKVSILNVLVPNLSAPKYSTPNLSGPKVSASDLSSPKASASKIAVPNFSAPKL